MGNYFNKLYNSLQNCYSAIKSYNLVYFTNNHNNSDISHEDSLINREMQDEEAKEMNIKNPDNNGDNIDKQMQIFPKSEKTKIQLKYKYDSTNKDNEIALLSQEISSYENDFPSNDNDADENDVLVNVKI